MATSIDIEQAARPAELAGRRRREQQAVRPAGMAGILGWHQSSSPPVAYCLYGACTARVPETLACCDAHWAVLPRELKRAWMKSWEPGQNPATASPASRQAREAIVAWSASPAAAQP